MDLDKVLEDIGGFGKYQIRRYILLCLLLIFSTFPTLSYVFTSRDLNYRCQIKGCDEGGGEFNPSWVKHAVPFTNERPQKCLRYAHTFPDNCTPESFSTNSTIRCTNFVYEDAETTIANDFDIVCDENLWKLTIVGTINNLGFIAGLPLSGYISDRYGRRTMMLVAVMFSTLFGIVKSFSPSYLYFIIFEFMDMCLGAGAYSATYILGMELLTARNRVVGSTVMSCAFAVGEAALGLVAWMTFSWRTMIRILYIPGVVFVTYYWLTDESVRWMISKEKHERAQNALKKIAKENNRRLNTSAIKHLNFLEEESGHNTTDSFLDVFKSARLFLRLVNCSFAWVCCTFVYYGLTMHSVGISGNVHVNYIAVSLIEIPAYIAANFSLNKFGRRHTLSFSFLLSGLACLGFVFTPESDQILKLVLFLTGKFAVTIAYATIYLYTTEMFPTSLRHSFMSVCSMFGRVGSMVAPQVPILARVSPSLPLILFGAMASTSGLLSLLFPETLNVKLPDNIKEAIEIGKKKETIITNKT